MYSLHRDLFGTQSVGVGIRKGECTPLCTRPQYCAGAGGGGGAGPGATAGPASNGANGAVMSVDPEFGRIDELVQRSPIYNCFNRSCRPSHCKNVERGVVRTSVRLCTEAWEQSLRVSCLGNIELNTPPITNYARS